MAKVELKGVTKRYPGGVLAVEEFSLDVEPGEFVVFVGPSGCGKTTTLRMIAGLEEVTSGTVSIDGRVVNRVPPKDRDIAMVFQHYALYPHMNVYGNLAFALRLRRYPRAEIDARVREVAGLLGIGDLLDRAPEALSGGQRQRVALGRALVRRPRVFLFDEPLSNLDAKMRAEMRMEISKLHARLGATMIYVTHDQLEAISMGDRIVVMKDGRIQQIAVPIQVYQAPVNRFVAGFFGSPPMNFFQGRIEADEETVCFEEGGFRLRVEESQATKVGAYRGREIVFGIRPEDLSDALYQPSAPHDQSIPARVEVVEPMGAETLLYLATDTHTFVARLDARQRATENQQVRLVPDMRKVHFFDPATGSTVA